MERKNAETTPRDDGRDFTGYGAHRPKAPWPEDAAIAVQFVLNYEEGGERSVLAGDSHAETFLSEIIGARPITARHMSMESLYEYGTRVGVWRLLDLFRAYQVPLTVFGVATAMARTPGPIEQALKDGHEICSHGYRWLDYQNIPPDLEADHIARAVELHHRITGTPPRGWYTGRTSPNTRRLVVEHGGFLYDADDYSDELPFWTHWPQNGAHLVIPYTLDCNDMRFATAQGFNSGEQFYNYLQDSFRTLYEEGQGDAARRGLLSVGLHCRLAGRPGRFQALKRFVASIRSLPHVWFCRRIDIAHHWATHHPPAPPAS